METKERRLGKLNRKIIKIIIINNRKIKWLGRINVKGVLIKLEWIEFLIKLEKTISK